MVGASQREILEHQKRELQGKLANLYRHMEYPARYRVRDTERQMAELDERLAAVERQIREADRAAR